MIDFDSIAPIIDRFLDNNYIVAIDSKNLLLERK